MVAQEIYDCGVDIITLGNHTWARKEIKNFITSDPKIIRPANYPKGVPGKGCTTLSMNGTSIGVINLLGRVYMDSIECPFRTAEKEINAIKKQCVITSYSIHYTKLYDNVWVLRDLSRRRVFRCRSKRRYSAGQYQQ